MGVYRTELADAMLEEITERKGAVFAFLRRNGYECYESQAPDLYFSNINDPVTYQKIVNKKSTLFQMIRNKILSGKEYLLYFYLSRCRKPHFSVIR